MNGAEVRAEVNGPEIIITAEDGEETAESTKPEEAPQEYSMALYYHVTGEQRKALVTAVSAFVDAPAVYQNAPTFAYAIGEYSVDKEGTLTGPASEALVAALQGKRIYGGIILGQTKSAHAEVILPDMSAFLTVVVLFVFHLARHGGEAPCGAFFGVEGAAGFLAQFLAGDEFGLYNKSWGKEQKSGQSKPNQVKWKCKNPQPEEGILCPRKIIAQNS